MAYRRCFLFPALCALGLFTMSCGDDGTEGDIENGSFGYRCVSDRDPMCSTDTNIESGNLKPMPGKVALGASFGIAFTSETAAAQEGSAVIAPVSAKLLAGTTDADTMVFTAQKSGTAGILARRGSTVVDVIHVALAAVDHLRIDSPSPASDEASPVEIGAGALLTLSAITEDASDEMLAGSLNHAWTSDDPTIAEIVTSSSTDTITVRGGTPGQTSVHASAGGVDATVFIKVTGGAP